MIRVLGLMLLLLSLLVVSEFAHAQCADPKKIYEKTYGPSGNLANFESQIDKENNTYLVGCYHSGPYPLDLGNGMILPNVGLVNHILLIKFDRNANPLWYRLIKTNNGGSTPTITIDSFGFIYITTRTAYPLTIDNINIYLKFIDGVIIKFSPDGKAIWGKGIIGKGNNGNITESMNIAITPKANVYVSGWFGGDSLKFDNFYLKKKSIPTQTTNLFIAKYDSSGKFQWAVSESSSEPTALGYVDFTRICTDNDENVYVAGKFQGKSTDIKLGKFKLTKSSDSVVLFIAKYNKGGEAIWAKLIKVNHQSALKPNNFIYNGNGSLYLLFDYVYEARIDSFRFGGTGTQKLGLMRMDTSGRIIKTNYFYSSSSFVNTNDLKTDKQGNLYFGGVASVDFKIDKFEHIADTLNPRFSFTFKTDPDFTAIWAYFYDVYNWYEENDCITIDDSGKVNLIITTYDTIADVFKFFQLKNNFSVYPFVGNNNKCYEDEKGVISIRMLEGKRPYSVQWQSGYGSDTILSNLPGGIYHVKVTDANGCEQNLSLKVYSPPILRISATVKNDYRNRQQGEITLNVTGGTPPYKYKWDDPFNSTSNWVYNLFAGTYTCTITDSNGCVYDSAFTVSNTTGIDDLYGTKVLVYPNPVTSGLLNIELQELPEDLFLSLYDGIGRELISKKVPSGSSFHDQLSFPSKGIYMLKMEMGGRVLVKKVVVE